MTIKVKITAADFKRSQSSLEKSARGIVRRIIRHEPIRGALPERTDDA